MKALGYIDRHPRPTSLVLSAHNTRIVLGILIGDRPHRDLKVAFDWEETPEGHSYWAYECHAPKLSPGARVKLARAAKLDTENLMALTA